MKKPGTRTQDLNSLRNIKKQNSYQSKYLDIIDDTAKDTFLQNAVNVPYLLDIETFHRGFDHLLSELDLLNLFDETGKLCNRRTYGIICNLARQSKVSLALRKFWALQFSENAKTPEEIAAYINKKYGRLER